MHVFVSHSSTDAGVAMEYTEALETAGYKAWISSRDIKPGANWQAEISRALSSAQAVVFLLSEAAVNSPQVLKEITFAESERKALLPIVLPGCTFPFADPALRFIFQGVHTAIADGDASLTVNKLLDSIPSLAVDADESVEEPVVASSAAVTPSSPIQPTPASSTPSPTKSAEPTSPDYAFDPTLGIYYVNVGEGPTRNWDDCRKYGFLTAGGDPKWSDPIRKLVPGDVVVAYLKGHGYVGVGRVMDEALPFGEFQYDGAPLAEQDLVEPGIARAGERAKDQEYLARIEWISTVPREQAKFKSKSGLFTSMLIRASLSRQPATVEFVNRELGVDLVALASVETPDDVPGPEAAAAPQAKPT